jgi:hypothetical protein
MHLAWYSVNIPYLTSLSLRSHDQALALILHFLSSFDAESSRPILVPSPNPATIKSYREAPMPEALLVEILFDTMAVAE